MEAATPLVYNIIFFSTMTATQETVAYERSLYMAHTEPFLWTYCEDKPGYLEKTYLSNMV